MSELIQRTFKITELDDAMLVHLAENSGTLSKSAELRQMIRAEFERRGLTLPEREVAVVPAEQLQKTLSQSIEIPHMGMEA
jgi:hypothetical protein